MPQISVPGIRINHRQLQKFGSNLLNAAGLNGTDAELVSDSLVESNLRGIDSHGIARLPHYVARIAAGSITPVPDINVTELAPATSVVDGGHGLGQVVMNRAADEAIRLAQQSGAGWAAVRNSSHCGALSYYGLKIAAAGMIGIVFTHVDSMVVPHGAAEPFCGTNPVCITAPGVDDRTLCLDMATSITPWNSIRNAATEGVSIPANWAIDSTGAATTDPNRVAAVHPFGEHKGSGLGIVIDMLCALLSGSPIGPDVPRMYGDLTQRRRLGGLVGAIDIGRFLSPDDFRQRLTVMLNGIGGLKSLDANGRVLFPGEPELICHAERSSSGIPMGQGVINDLNECARQHGQVPLATE